MREAGIKLQAALDLYSLQEAAQCAAELSDAVDILEVGTPLLLGEGLHAVREIRKIAADVPLVADTKIMDGGYDAAKLAFAAGADIVTVLGAAADVTIAETLKAAAEAGGTIMVDLINVLSPMQRIKELAKLGATLFLFHLPRDLAAKGEGWDVLEEEFAELPRCQVAVAGGLHAGNVEKALTLRPSIVIVGSAIYKAQDPAKEARKIKDLISQFGG